MKSVSISAFFVLALTLLLAQPVPAAIEQNFDNRAIEVLKSIKRYFAGFDTAKLLSETTTDERLEAGLVAERATVSEILIRRPNQIRVSMKGDSGAVDIYINNGELTIFTPKMGYFARASVDPDLDKAVHHAIDELEIEIPFFQEVYGRGIDQMLEEFHSVLYLGTTTVRGVECHHLVLREPEFDTQIFIATGDKPEPRKYVMTSRWEGGAPRFTAFLQWTLPAEIDDEIFVFKSPKGATEIPFRNAGSGSAE